MKAPAKAAQYTFKIGGDQPVEVPASIRAKQMWAAIERESNGRVQAQFFPNNQLGGDPSMLTQLRAGALQFFIIASPVLAAVVPVADIANIGFAFKDSEDALRTFDGPLGDIIKSESEAKGMHLLPKIWDSGIRGIGSSSHPIRTPDDLRGFKIRVVGRISLEMFKTLGANPVPLSFDEVYTALQTHLVDGEDVPMATKQGARLFEVEKYLSLTNHSWSGLWTAANADLWKSLPPDIKGIIERNQVKYTAYDRRDAKLLGASIIDKLVRQGMTANNVDPTSFRALLKPYYNSWAATFGPTAWSMLENSLGRKLT